jgi:asparagine synthase (glutamine-hydrolysing)
MCGIAGIISFKQKVHVSDVKKMTDAIAHRGPDGEGQWLEPENECVALGHRRLSIIDLSENGAQPMHFNNRYVITFNGEIYNYPELKKQLQLKNYVFHSGSDTEVLLAMYAEYQEKCLSYLDGMFAFAIWDRLKGELFCARDRFGEKPFYYYFDEYRFLFASEIKSIHAYGIKKEVNEKNLFYYLAYNIVEDPGYREQSFYKNIFQLNNSCYMKLNLSTRPDSLKQFRYWEINEKNTSNISEKQACQQFLELLTSSVNIRLRSDVPVGSSLSGGIDSSTIVCLINELNKAKGIKGNQITFSARFDDATKDEGNYMQKVIAQTRVQAYSTYVKSSALIDDIVKIIYHQEEPFGSSSIVAQWEVMKLASQHNVTVLLDGQGADEYLAGYLGFYKIFFSELNKTNKQKLAEQLKYYEQVHGVNYLQKEGLSNNSFLNSLTAGLRKMRNNLTIPRFMTDLNIDFCKTYKRLPNPYLQFEDLNSSLKYSTVHCGLGNLLRYADRNSMAFSREVRLPFLSHHLVEFVFSLPNEFKIHNGWTKYILRKSVENSIPRDIAWRKDKLGYTPPEDKWMKDKYVNELIRDGVSILKNKKYIEQFNENKKWQYLIASLLLNS